MEEDLKLLEEFIEAYRIAEEVLDGNIIQAIENLIARYKELNKENQSYKDYYGTPPCYDNAKYIPKSKVKEKIEELENQKTLYFEKQVIQGRINLLQELLED